MGAHYLLPVVLGLNHSSLAPPKPLLFSATSLTASRPLACSCGAPGFLGAGGGSWGCSLLIAGLGAGVMGWEEGREEDSDDGETHRLFAS